jgi:hypothetical protein
LDSSIGFAKPDGPIATADGTRYLPFALPLTFGKGFPVTPSIDREGIQFSNFQNQLQANIVRLHNRLVDNCHWAFDLENMIWFHDLRMLLNECVGVVDITLHQLYFKAQYGPKPAAWQFDPDKLGPRQGVRLRE